MDQQVSVRIREHIQFLVSLPGKFEEHVHDTDEELKLTVQQIQVRNDLKELINNNPQEARIALLTYLQERRAQLDARIQGVQNMSNEKLVERFLDIVQDR